MEVQKKKEKIEFDESYSEWKDMEFRRFESRKPDSGREAQNMTINTLNVSSEDLTERSRLIAILPTIVFEVEKNMLTEELSDELWLYYEDLQEGRLAGLFGAEEEKEVFEDLRRSFKKAFPDEYKTTT